MLSLREVSESEGKGVYRVFRCSKFDMNFGANNSIDGKETSKVSTETEKLALTRTQYFRVAESNSKLRPNQVRRSVEYNEIICDLYVSSFEKVPS